MRIKRVAFHLSEVVYQIITASKQVSKNVVFAIITHLQPTLMCATDTEVARGQTAVLALSMFGQHEQTKSIATYWDSFKKSIYIFFML